MPDPLITPHPALARLGRTPDERRRNHRDRVKQAAGAAEIEAIRRHVQHQRIYGPDRFRHAIERKVGRKVGPQKVGRPKKIARDPADLIEKTRL